LLFLVIFTNIGFADDNSSDIEKLNAKILQLQQQMLEMQKKHDKEIAALKKQINDFADQAAKQETKDELASLRELAQAEAAKEKPEEERLEDVTFKSGGLSAKPES